MERMIKGTVQYVGTNFHGWQIQKNGRTVQEEIQRALSQIASKPVPVQGAGRTDSGVHALGQVISFPWSGAFPGRLRRALSHMLRPEIRIVSLEEVPDDFNACFSALSKRYIYSLDFGRDADPFSVPFAWHVPYRVDMDLLVQLLPQLEGEHDFAGFQSTGSQPKKTTVRIIYSARLHRGALMGMSGNPDLWRIEFHGNGFLYRMVRNLSGTLIEIARGRFPVEFLGECLRSPGPFVGHCAPAHGLVMGEVFYDDVVESGDKMKTP
jgi:tRNA pseudouridine38-40 synthase